MAVETRQFGRVVQSHVAAPNQPVRRARPALRRGGFGTRERMFFTERLALLIETGSPLHIALETLEGQASNAEMQQMIRELRDDVAEGRTFAQALTRREALFPQTYINLVAAGEGGGFLAEVLHRLVEMDEKRRELSASLVSAFSYPAFLIVFSTAVVIFILTAVFPKFSDLFVMIADQLPISTVILLAVSDFMRDYWPFILGIVAGGSVLIARWLHTAAGAQTFDRLLLRIPFVRDIMVQLYVVQFMRAMSLSLHHGVTMVDALRACGEVVGSPTFRGFVRDLESDVSQGATLTPSFQAATFLPELVPQMISTAEESGNLALVMGQVADFYEREWKKALLIFAKIAEPAMLLVMGVVVGTIVSSLILPIFRIASAVH